MWLYIVNIFLIYLSRIACQEVKTITRCLADGHVEFRLQCPPNSNIQVGRVIMTKTRTALGMDWCANPWFDQMDCIAYEQELTEEFRQSCNRFQICPRLSPFTALDQCGPNYHQGIVYQHVEYRCVPEIWQTMEIQPKDSTLKTGREVQIFSQGYPSAWMSVNTLSCNITLPPNVKVELEVLELSYKLDSVCPFLMWTNPSEPVCAKKTGKYDIFRLGPHAWGGNEILHFRSTVDISVPVRFWFTSKAKEPLWQARDRSQVSLTQITCRSENVTQYQNPVPDTRTTAFPSKTDKATVLDNNSDSEKETKNDIDIKAIIAGSVVGTLVVIALIVLLVVLLCMRKRHSQGKENSDLAYNCHANFNIALAKESGRKGSGTSILPLKSPHSTPCVTSKGSKVPHLKLINSQICIEENTYADIRTPKTPMSPQYAEIGSPLYRQDSDSGVPIMTPLYDDTALAKARRQFQDPSEGMSPAYATTIESDFVPVYAKPDKTKKEKDPSLTTPPLHGCSNRGFQLVHDVITANTSAVRPYKKKPPVPIPAEKSIAELYAQPHKPAKLEKPLPPSDIVFVDNELYTN